MRLQFYFQDFLDSSRHVKVMFVDKNKSVSLCFEKTLRKNVSETLVMTSLREGDQSFCDQVRV